MKLSWKTGTENFELENEIWQKKLKKNRSNNFFQDFISGRTGTFS